MNLRTAIYIRVSTEEQVQEGFSVRGQTEKLKSYALLKEWEIYNIYSDEGISGKNIVDRPAINMLIDDIKNGKVNNVLVFRVDRLTRSTKNLIELVELFEDYNCTFNSLTESIDTDTPSGRMFLKIIGIFAEFERENLAVRLKLGFERKVKEGYTLASNNITYGYVRKKGEKIETVNQEEARIVKEIFELFVVENKSMTNIARALNGRNIKTKKGATWLTNKVKKILTNPTYIGKVRYSIENENRYFEADGHHEKIISEEMFLQAQEKIKTSKNHSKTKLPNEENYFCGFLVCSKCGMKFTTRWNSYERKSDGEKVKKLSYRCRSKSFPCDNIICGNAGTNHEKMEVAFINYINKIAEFTEIENIEVNNKNKENKKNEYLKSIETFEKKLINLSNKKKRLMEQYISEEIMFEGYREMVEVLNKKYEVLENETQRLKKELPDEIETDDITHEDIIKTLKENWGYLNNKEKMRFLQRFIKQIGITIQRTNGKSNIITIDKLEFNNVKVQS